MTPERPLRLLDARSTPSARMTVAFDADRLSAAEAVLAALRAAGCACSPEIVVKSAGGLRAEHADWCPLLRALEDRN